MLPPPARTRPLVGTGHCALAFALASAARANTAPTDGSTNTCPSCTLGGILGGSAMSNTVARIVPHETMFSEAYCP